MENLNDKAMMARCFHRIGYQQKDINEAIKYLTLALNNNEEINNEVQAVKNINVMAWYYY